MSDPVGWLVYASTGEFHPERSTTVEEMCQRVGGKSATVIVQSKLFSTKIRSTSTRNCLFKGSTKMQAQFEI